jgi:prepilin-type N-terminal cleavage/methylation domain-containing protein
MSAGVRASRRGFSLIELMVVIIIIGVVAALAVPTMAAARTDRHAYDDAGMIMQFFREARTRAVARGGAVLIAFTAGGGDVGTFNMFESVTVNPGAAGGANRAPVASCKTPTVWKVAAPDPNTLLVDALNLNGMIEQQNGIQTSFVVYDPIAGPQTGFTGGFVCFTPLGRTYFNQVQPVFDGALPTLAPLEFQVKRMSGSTSIGTIRSVLLPPNGMARVFSHV